MYLAIMAIYYYGLRGLPDGTPPSKIFYSDGYRHAQWVAIGEAGETQMEPVSPVGMVIEGVKYLNSKPEPNKRHKLPPGLRLAMQNARVMLMQQDRTGETNLYRQLKGLSTTLWVTNHWTANEALSNYLSRSYFGHGRYGVESAAKEYFNKDYAQLDVYEIALLMALQKSSSFYDPWCHEGRAVAQVNHVVKLLSANWPEKYAKLAKLKILPASLVARGKEYCGGAR